ncbi:MAG: 1-acyl-sn-glycerol-3-phosphate acyltransferase [Clostridia bacterium]|nr:1-acyl-sn-glycerol-3-phosphate acyltransferase [Clostridia bacterium]
MAKKDKQWRKKRHTVMKKITSFLSFPIVKIKYHAKIKKHKDKRQCVILANHQTAWDQFFIGLAFKQPIYYLVSEDLFSGGLLSRIWQWAIGPIAIKKSTFDVRAVMNCMKVAKEGGTIAIFPEGNRTYSGTTEYISPAIVKMVKKMKLPIAFFRIEGGYGIEPRWSDVTRKGKMQAYVSKIMEYDEYKDFTDEELFAIVEKELYVNESIPDGCFSHKKRAEYLERAIYVCPDCGITEFESDGNIVKCKKCGKKIEYTENKQVKGLGFDFNFASIKEWYDYQSDYMNALDLTQYVTTSLFSDNVDLYNVELYKRKQLINKQIRLHGYGDRFTFNEDNIDFNDVHAVTVLGRNKLNVYYKDKVYQIKGGKRFNALKYVHLFYRYRQIIKGDANDKFLGL